MDEEKKKYVMIGTIVVCIALAAGITYFNMGGSGGSSRGPSSITMLCDSCGATYELTSEEFREQTRNSPMGRNPMMMPGPMILPCKECNEIAAYRAMTCTQCSEVFVEGDAEDDKYRDRCPGCGYSSMEQRAQRK